MVCPSCGKENISPPGNCLSCGQGFSTTTGAAAAPAQASVFKDTLKLQQNRAAIPAAVIAVLVVMVFGFQPFTNTIQWDSQPEQRMRRLMREAAGLQPARNSIFPSQRRFDDAFREQFRNLIHANREFLQDLKNADRSAIKQLYTPASFANPASASAGLKQLHGLYDADVAHEQKMTQLLAIFRQTIKTSISSPGERQAFEDQFNQALAQPMAKIQSVMAAEQAWIQSVDDLYGYAQDNHSAFLLRNGPALVINNSRIRTEFNSRIRLMNARRNEFLQAKGEADRWRTEQMRKSGITGQELGIL